MSTHIRKQHILVILLLIFSFSCSREEESLYAENVAPVSNEKDYTGPVDFLTDLGTLNINVIANGNHPGKNDPAFIKNINAPNFGYCHPDVQYFPNGLSGYKYWMVFTPYMGVIGANLEAIRYENPTVVASNDGLNWVSPAGIASPIQRCPSDKESFTENKDEAKQGYWSDVDMTFENGKFSLYYRSSFIRASSLMFRGAKNNNNIRKLSKNAQRTIVRQTSADGIHWSPLEAAYTSNPPYSPKNNHMLSPSFVYTGNKYISYEVENNISPNFPGNDPSYVIRRTSDNGLDFSNFKQSKVVNFMNKPWADVNPLFAPWHIQATYVDGYYFLCIAAGDVKKYTADTLYLAFSKDGINFKVFPKSLVEHNTYRSCIFPKTTTSEVINFGAVIAYKTGQFKYREFQLNKARLDACLSK